MRYRPLLFALTLSLSIAPTFAANPALEHELQNILDTFLAEDDSAPGLSACVICPDLEFYWSGAAGTVAHDDATPLTAEHTFRIASNAKTYVAAAMLRLVEMGRLDLDDPLSKHLAPDEIELLASDGYDTDAITMTQVLSHTAGFADHTRDPRFEVGIMADTQRLWTAAEMIDYLVDWCDPVGKPGEQYSYSDSGYVILGTIIARLTGRELGPAVRHLLDYESLGLDDTYWELMEEAPTPVAPRAHQYYGVMDVTDWNPSFDLYGGGGIVTDARELTLFLRELLTGYVLTDDATLIAMTERGSDPYRLGLMVTDCNGREAFGHGGFWNTFAYHIPALDLTIGGSVMNHHATDSRELWCRLVQAVAAHSP